VKQEHETNAKENLEKINSLREQLNDNTPSTRQNLLDSFNEGKKTYERECEK
jgi:hypothetical protein